MNREIEFRGFYPCEEGENIIYKKNEKIKGEWCYGYYEEVCTCILKPPMTKCCIRDVDQSLRGVICKTVGQYTGLKDKNGKKIFEGDVVIFDSGLGGTEIAKVYYDDYQLSLNIRNSDASGIKDGYIYDGIYNLRHKKNVEVIGTIFDEEDKI